MNIHLPNGASGHYPAPANHIVRDPTPLDQAVYIPSVTPTYAIAAYKQDWPRGLPAGVSPEDMNFLDPNNRLFRISHVMSSAGQAFDQNQPCIIQQRDRSQTMMIADSGGYQIAGGQILITSETDILRILRWQEHYADWAMTLDVPTGNVGRPEYRYKTFRDCLDTTLTYLDFYKKHRKEGATKFLNVLQGNKTADSDVWFDAVKGYPFEGWAFAGKLRHSFWNLCRRLIQMGDQKLIQDRNWIHVLGTCKLEIAVGLTALQRAINKHGYNPHLRISYDTATPFRMLAWGQSYSVLSFDGKSMTLGTQKCPDGRALVGSPVRFPWPSPLGDLMSLGDLNVREGSNLNCYRDNTANFLLAHHNLAALCYAVATANRIFDSEAIMGEHSIATPMGEAIAAIDEVLQAGTMAALNKRRRIFDLVTPIDEDRDADVDRAPLS